MSEDAPELTAELVVDGAVPSQPVISPDGCWAAYAVAPAGCGGERRTRSLWVAAADGSSPPWQLTAGYAVFLPNPRGGVGHGRYPREGHGFAERNHQLDLLRRTRAWFDRWLRDEAADGRGSPA